MKAMFQEFLKKYLLAFILFTIPATEASANVQFTILRLSDTSGILTATGSVDGPTPPGHTHLLLLDNPFTIAPTGNSNPLISSTLAYGGVTLPFLNDAASTYNLLFNNDPVLYLGFDFDPVFTPSGSFNDGTMSFNLIGGATLAPIGSSGTASWGIYINPYVIGNWVITSVPEPESFVMMLTGLGLIIFIQRKRLS